LKLLHAFVLAHFLLPVHKNLPIQLYQDIIPVSAEGTSILQNEPIYEGARFNLADTIEPVTTVTAVQADATSSGVVSNCGDNADAHIIFEEESGCSLTAVNAISGDFGLGQSSGALATQCPDWQTDYTCQDGFFNSYAISRYGSWSNALAFHEANGWW
jgi:hypothetical protein